MKLDPRSVPYRVLSRTGQVGWAVVVALAVGSERLPAGIWPLVVAAIALLLVGTVVYEYVHYQRFDYELTESTLDIASGVLSRRVREIPYGRVQNVDVTRDVLQRALGISTVRIETAGGGSTEAELECVTPDEAERLQTRIRQLKTAKGEGQTEGSDTEATEGPTGTVLYELDRRSLLAYSFLSFDPRLLSGIAVLYPLLGPLLADLGLRRPGPTGASVFVLALTGAGLVLLGALIWMTSAAVRFVQYYGFRLVQVGDDLQYERGLLNRYTGTIPLEKLQTISVTENLLLRRVGYASLAVETAGYAPGDAPSGGSEAAVPFAPREDVVALARSLEPFEGLAVNRPPTRARRRYAGRYSLLAAAAVVTTFAAELVLGVPFWWLTAALVPVAVVAGHYRWRHLGHAEQAEHAVTRAGFWSRTTTVVPYERLQTVVESRSLFQRRWRLASVVYDTAGTRSLGSSDAVAHDVDEETASGLVSTAAAGLRQALESD